MISREKYVTSSLELHLFFMRVMKEHAIFLEAGLGPKNSKLAKELDKLSLIHIYILNLKYKIRVKTLIKPCIKSIKKSKFI